MLNVRIPIVHCLNRQDAACSHYTNLITLVQLSKLNMLNYTIS